MPKVWMRLSSLSVTLIASLGLACGGGGGAEPMGCGTSGEVCTPTGRCLAGSCVEDLPPVAAIALPADLRTLALTAFDGSASSDPDAALGDEVAAYEWTFTRADPSCDAPQVVGTSATAQVRFACAGRYAVQLVVTDQLGKTSAPATREFDVAEGSSLVHLSADQVLNHRCGGNPAVCTTEDGDPSVTATVDASAPTVGALHYTWTALPPSGPLGADRRVTFPSAPTAGSTLVHIETGPGTFIQDDWPIQVSVSDTAGPLGVATTRISIGNRAPVVVAAAASVAVDHVYALGAYRASAAGARFQDPDGDPLTPVATGSTPCPAFTLAADGTAQIACQRPFTGTLGLTGFAGTHVVDQQVKDPWNETSPVSSTAVTIKNRAATATSTSQTARRDCDEGTCCLWDKEPGMPQTCVANRLSCSAGTSVLEPSITDPDGDPVQLTWTSGDLGTGASPVFELGAFTGSYAVPGGAGCGATPSGSAAGTFTVSDGLTTSAPATLTLTWGG